MAAIQETLYRDAPHQAPERIDVSSVPDCGAAAIAKLRLEADRHSRIRGRYAWPLWLSGCALVLGITTVRQQPLILVFSFIVLRDICIGFWLNSDRARLVRLAIDEIVKAHGPGRAEREACLRADIIAWNAEAENCSARLWSSEWLTSRQRRAIREASQLNDRRRFLVSAIGALRGDAHADV